MAVWKNPKRHLLLTQKFYKKVYVLISDPTIVVVQYVGDEQMALPSTKTPAVILQEIDRRVEHELARSIYQSL
ncbi:unnamed protein product, partial [Didymodactylos carnosus]